VRGPQGLLRHRRRGALRRRGYNATTKGIFCDKTVALAGDPCDTEAFKTCAADGKNLLSCAASKFAQFQACKTDCVPSQTGAAKCQ
jgi:hypothetical protein